MLFEYKFKGVHYLLLHFYLLDLKNLLAGFFVTPRLSLLFLGLDVTTNGCRGVNLNEWNDEEIKDFDATNNISNIVVIVQNKEEEPDQDHVQHLQCPRGKESNEAYSIGPVSKRDGFGIENGVCQVVVVLPNVVKQNEVTGELGNGKDNAEHSEEKNYVLL